VHRILVQSRKQVVCHADCYVSRYHISKGRRDSTRQLSRVGGVYLAMYSSLYSYTRFVCSSAGIGRPVLRITMNIFFLSRLHGPTHLVHRHAHIDRPGRETTCTAFHYFLSRHLPIRPV